MLQPVPRELWSKAPEAVAIVAAHATGKKPLILDRDATHGIARALELPIDPAATTAIGIDCNAAGTRCTPRPDDPGVSIAYAHSVLIYRLHKLPIDFGSGILQLAAVESVYDPKTETLYLARRFW